MGSGYRLNGTTVSAAEMASRAAPGKGYVFSFAERLIGVGVKFGSYGSMPVRCGCRSPCIRGESCAIVRAPP